MHGGLGAAGPGSNETCGRAKRPATKPTKPPAVPAKPATAPAKPAAAPVRHAAPSSPSVAGAIPINRTVIVLDPAHGGVDSGSQISDTTVEKDVTLALAFRLRSLLTARGFSVVMTRDAGRAGGSKCGGLGADAGRSRRDREPRACGGVPGTPRHAERERGPSLPVGAGGKRGTALVVPWLTAQAAWVAQSGLLEKQMASAFSRSGLALVASSASVRPIDSLTCPALVVELAPSGDDANSINDTDYQQRVALAIAGELLSWQNQVQPPTRLAAAPSATVGPATASDAGGAKP